MRTYTPRRASKRWLAEAPEYILDCFDNRGKTMDRYTVILGKQLMYSDPTSKQPYLSLLDMSDAPSHPQGVSMWGTYPAFQIAQYRYREGHHRVKWMGLPEHIREHVVMRVNEGD